MLGGVRVQEIYDTCADSASLLADIAVKLAPLAGLLSGREAGIALAQAYTALSNLLPKMTLPSEILTGLTAVSTTEVTTRPHTVLLIF